MSPESAPEIAGKDIVISRTLNASLDEVWKAWSEPEYVMRWWGPTGFTCPSARMDFREGGTSLVCMRASEEQGGKDFYNTWTYQKIVPMTLIEFTVDFALEDGTRVDPVKLGLSPETPRDARHLVTFRVLEENKTEMTLTEYGYTSEEKLQRSKTGLEQCLDKMAAIWR